MFVYFVKYSKYDSSPSIGKQSFNSSMKRFYTAKTKWVLSLIQNTSRLFIRYLKFLGLWVRPHLTTFLFKISSFWLEEILRKTSKHIFFPDYDWLTQGIDLKGISDSLITLSTFPGMRILTKFYNELTIKLEIFLRFVAIKGHSNGPTKLSP